MSPSIILGLLRVVKTEMTNWPHGNGLNKGSSINDIMHLGGGRGEKKGCHKSVRIWEDGVCLKM